MPVSNIQAMSSANGVALQSFAHLLAEVWMLTVFRADAELGVCALVVLSLLEEEPVRIDHASQRIRAVRQPRDVDPLLCQEPLVLVPPSRC